MEPVVDAVQSADGIVVTYISGTTRSSEFFTYEDLIRMKINVSALLDHPGYYGVDPSGHGIKRTDFCRPDMHTKGQ
ncbi:MAG: hypothetical protein APR53_04090 [Methanoculleus sp. SDB]|nr:MAG: hypothetical protein APR53_04090 [Methanoculleus sp. SDB]